MDEFDWPDSKRQKLDTHLSPRPLSSRLFAPYRTIGLVSSTPVPFTSVPLGKATFQITTSVGRSLQTYDLRRGLSLVFLSRPQCPQTITATYAHRDKVFAAWGRANGSRGIWVFKRGRVVADLDLVNTIEQEIHRIVVFGKWIVASGSRAIEVWHSETNEHYTTISPRIQNSTEETFSNTLCTMPTFLNKVFIGRSDGSTDIYNISTGKLVHSIPSPQSSHGKVTALAPSLAISIIAVAYADGSISLIDVETDDTIMKLRQGNDQRPVTSITFRSDGAGAGSDGQEEGVMATSSIESGDITLWDLNHGGRIMGVTRGAHQISKHSRGSGITRIEFLPGQPTIISSGMDNAIKSWEFDQIPFSPIPRSLHTRSGHSSPISILRFLPAASDGSEAAGKWLLSAGHDRSLWGFSLRKDGQSSELSQGQIKSKAKRLGMMSDNSSNLEDLKVPPIVSIACSLNRDGGMGAIGGPIWANPKSINAEQAGTTGWESVVTAHEGDNRARTWFWGRKKAGRWAFESSDRKPVTSVAITSCGTFAIIGSAGGALDMFNLQSGMHRMRFPPKINPSQAKLLKIQEIQSGTSVEMPNGHHDSITGIIVDSLNQKMISISLDSKVIFWNFATGQIQQSLMFETGLPVAMRYNSVSNLISISCDDLCIRVVDIDTTKTVRELWGCTGQIYDHCFSHDGRWIVAASMDSVIRIFDLATGHLIDAFKTATCTNVAFSSTGEFLATAHAGNIGINIWNNKSLYANIASRQIHEETGIIDLTSSSTFEGVSQLALEDEADMLGQEDTSEKTDTSMDQLDEALLTLSLVPQSRWQTLLNLDTIRERNKPIAPPEKPKAAPFFLGSANSTGGLLNNVSTEDNTARSENLAIESIILAEKSRIAKLSSLPDNDNAVTHLLDIYNQTSDPAQLITHLSILPPSQADLAIRTLTLSELPDFVNALTARLRQRRDFELINTWMAVLLRLHEEFAQVKAVRDALTEFKRVMDKEAERLAGLVGWVRGVGDYLRSSR